MALNYPDILQHNNSSYALLNASELRGTAFLIPSASATGSVPEDKRQLGSIVFASASQQFYGFIGPTTASWNTASSWVNLSTGGSSNGVFTNNFLIIASGSNATVDGGIIVQNSGSYGEALYWENNPSVTGRWAVTSSVSTSATTAMAAEYIVTVTKNTGAPSNAPTYGSSVNGYGNVYIDSGSGDIYIYS